MPVIQCTLYKLDQLSHMCQLPLKAPSTQYTKKTSQWQAGRERTRLVWDD